MKLVAETKIMHAQENRFTHIVRKTEEIVYAVIIIAMILIGLLPVVLRYANMSGVTWTESLSQHMVLWITFLGAGTAIRERASISIDALPNLLSPRKRLFLRGVTEFVSFAFCALIAWVSISFVKDTLEYEGTTNAFLHVREWWLTCALPAGFALLALRLFAAAVEDFILVFRTPGNNNNPPPPESDSEKMQAPGKEVTQ